MPIRKSREIEDQENSDRWLLTYADLITLLLAFFIVMYSMSRLDADKFNKMKTQLSSVLRGGSTIFPKGDEFDGAGAGMLKIGDLKMIQKRIGDKLMLFGGGSRGVVSGTPLDAKMAEAISTEVTERGLIIHIKDQLLFESGKADLKDEAKEVLSLLADEFKGIKNHIVIEGHTDNLPISTRRFPSNWELSTARATNVVRYLVENKIFDPVRVSARGFGEYRPIVSNASENGRARNRRVDIVVLTDALTMVEPKANDEVRNLVTPRPEINIVDSVQRASAVPDELDR